MSRTVSQLVHRSREAGDLDVLQWHFGPEHQGPVVSGTDIALVREGRISALCTVLDT